jgi:hypothetical protein
MHPIGTFVDKYDPLVLRAYDVAMRNEHVVLIPVSTGSRILRRNLGLQQVD